MVEKSSAYFDTFRKGPCSLLKQAYRQCSYPISVIHTKRTAGAVLFYVLFVNNCYISLCDCRPLSVYKNPYSVSLVGRSLTDSHLCLLGRTCLSEFSLMVARLPTKCPYYYSIVKIHIILSGTLSRVPYLHKYDSVADILLIPKTRV